MLELFLFLFGYTNLDYRVCETPKYQYACIISQEELDLLQEIKKLEKNKK